MRGAILLLIIFGSIPVIFAKPHIGVLLWSWVSYMNPHRFVWGFASDIPFALITAGVTLTAWLFSREPKRLPLDPLVVLLALFSLWISFTNLFAIYPEDGRGVWERAIKVLFFNVFVTLGLITSKERLNALIWVIVASIGFFGIKGGAFTILTAGNYRVFGPPQSFIADNNALALASLMVVPLMRYLQLTTTSRAVHVGLYAAMFLVLISVFGSHSRGALVALGALIFGFLITGRRRLLLATFMGLAVVLGIGFMPQKWADRMETIQTFEEDPSAQGRLKAWRYAVDLASERPIVGGGFGAFTGNIKSTDPNAAVNAHSIFFEVLGEHGYVGLLLFLGIGLFGFLSALRIGRTARNLPGMHWAADLARMVQVSLIVYAVAGSFLNMAFFDLYYHVLAMLVIANHLVAKAAQDTPGTEQTIGVQSARDLPLDAPSMPSLSRRP